HAARGQIDQFAQSLDLLHQVEAGEFAVADRDGSVSDQRLGERVGRIARSATNVERSVGAAVDRALLSRRRKELIDVEAVETPVQRDLRRVLRLVNPRGALIRGAVKFQRQRIEVDHLVRHRDLALQIGRGKAFENEFSYRQLTLGAHGAGRGFLRLSLLSRCQSLLQFGYAQLIGFQIECRERLVEIFDLQPAIDLARAKLCGEIVNTQAVSRETEVGVGYVNLFRRLSHPQPGAAQFAGSADVHRAIGFAQSGVNRGFERGGAAPRDLRTRPE